MSYVASQNRMVTASNGVDYVYRDTLAQEIALVRLAVARIVRASWAPQRASGTHEFAANVEAFLSGG